MKLEISKIKSAEEFETYFRSDDWREAAAAVCDLHQIAFTKLERPTRGENIVFFVDAKLVIKIYTPFRRGFVREKAALEFVSGKNGLRLPEIVHFGEIEGFDYLVMTQLEGESITFEEWQNIKTAEQVGIVSQLASILKELHSYDASQIEFDWNTFIEHQIATCLARQKAAGANPQWLEALPGYLETNLKLLPENITPVFLHGDVHFGNLRLKKENGKMVISGLYDLADSLTGFYEYEFVATGVLMIQGQGELQREFFRAYGYKDNEIDETLRRRLMLLTILYECSDLRKYALRLDPQAVNFTLDELEQAIWNFC